MDKPTGWENRLFDCLLRTLNISRVRGRGGGRKRVSITSFCKVFYLLLLAAIEHQAFPLGFSQSQIRNRWMCTCIGISNIIYIV